MVYINVEESGPKFLLFISFLFFSASPNQHFCVAAENVSMPCPGEYAPPLDIVFFFNTNGQYKLIKRFIMQIASQFYWSPDDSTKGVSITVQNFIGGDHDYIYPVVGARSPAEIFSLNITNQSLPVINASETFAQLLSYSASNPEAVIFRNNSEKVLVYIVEKNDYPDSEAWVNKMVELHSDFRIIAIGVGSNLTESHLQEASCCPRLANYSYWVVHSPEVIVEDLSDATELLYIYRDIAWAICSREVVSTPARLPPPMPCPGESAIPIDLLIFVTTNDFVAPEDFENLKSFLISLGYNLYLNHYNQKQGVQISIICVPGELDGAQSYATKIRSFYSLEMAVNEMTNSNGSDSLIHYFYSQLAEHETISMMSRCLTDSFVHNVIVLITNIEEPKYNELEVASAKLHISSNLITIGIGSSINQSQIRRISSKPRLENHNYFLLDSFDQLPALARNFSWAVCTNQWHSPPPIPPEHVRDPIPMPCPGRMQPPLDVVFFISTGTMSDEEYDLVITFLLSITHYLYLTPQDPSKGVSLSVVHFGIQSEVYVIVEGVVTKEDLGSSLNSINRLSNNGSEVFAENAIQEFLRRFVNNHSEQRILRENAEHVFIFIINKMFNDSNAWRTKLEQSFAGTNEYDIMNIAIGAELNGSENIRESASLPRLLNHNYWYLVSFQELVERVRSITWSICTRNMNPVPTVGVLPDIIEEDSSESTTEEVQVVYPSSQPDVTDYSSYFVEKMASDGKDKQLEESFIKMMVLMGVFFLILVSGVMCDGCKRGSEEDDKYAGDVEEEDYSSNAGDEVLSGNAGDEVYAGLVDYEECASNAED